MTTSPTVLDFYAESAPMTDPGPYAAQIDEFPADVGEIVPVIQGLLIYDVVASDFYGVDLPEERGDEIHLRPIEAMIERLMALEAKPLSAPRSADRRLAGRCRDYTVFLVAILRAKGIPARAGSASAPTSTRAASRITRSASTGTRSSSGGFSSTRSSTRCGMTSSDSSSTTSTSTETSS